MINLRKLYLVESDRQAWYDHLNRYVPQETMQEPVNNLKLAICYFSSLKIMPPEIGQLSNLREIEIRGCSSFQSISPEIGQMATIQKLVIWDCDSLTSLPPGIGKVMINLQELQIGSCCSFASLSPEIGQLVKLQKLLIRHCRSLTTMPLEIGELSRLQELDVRYCSSFTSLSAAFLKCCFSLRKLTICNCPSFAKPPPEIYHLTWLPAEIKELYSLEELEIRDCSRPIDVPFEISYSIKYLPPPLRIHQREEALQKYLP